MNCAESASRSDITPCNKIDKPQVVHNVMTIITLRKMWQNLDVSKCDF